MCHFAKDGGGRGSRSLWGGLCIYMTGARSHCFPDVEAPSYADSFICISLPYGRWLSVSYFLTNCPQTVKLGPHLFSAPAPHNDVWCVLFFTHSKPTTAHQLSPLIPSSNGQSHIRRRRGPETVSTVLCWLFHFKLMLNLREGHSTSVEAVWKGFTSLHF